MMRAATLGSSGGKTEEKRRRTRPSDASRSLTGHSRIEARKQKDEGSVAEAAGYQVKSRIGADWGRTRAGGCAKGRPRRSLGPAIKRSSDLFSLCARNPEPSGVLQDVNDRRQRRTQEADHRAHRAKLPSSLTAYSTPGTGGGMGAEGKTNRCKLGSASTVAEELL
jgi:hypothetical protein